MSTRNASLLAAACAAMLFANHAGAASAIRDYGYSAYSASRVGEARATGQVDLLPGDPDGYELQPGEFAWLPDSEAASSAPVTLLVSLRDQRGYLYRDGRRIAVTTLSTGVPGHDTPTGVFPIMGKEKMHHSNKYDNAPMPWMQRLTDWGHALHAGHVRAGTASHGCVRLPAEFARQLFSLTRPGDLVVISQDPSTHALAVAGVNDQIAPMVGVNEPLPHIVFVSANQQPGIAAEASSAPTAF